MKPSRILIISGLFLILAFLLAEFSDRISNKSRFARNVEEKLQAKKEKVHIIFNRLEKHGETSSSNIIEKADKEGIVLLRYIENELVFWSSNAIPIYEIYPDSLYTPRLAKFFNSIYYIEKIQTDTTVDIGLIKIKSKFSYVNEFLVSGFVSDFQLPDNASMGFDPDAGYSVHDSDDTYLFSILVKDQIERDDPRSMIATIFLIFGLILFGVFILRAISLLTDQHKQFAYSIGTIFVLVLVRILQLSFTLGFSGFALFDPFIFADSQFVPSLGDLLINSLIVLFSILLLDRFAVYDLLVKPMSSLHRILVFILTNILVVAYFIYAHYFSHSLIFNSNIAFQANEIDQLTFHSLISFLIHGINFFAAIMAMFIAIRRFGMQNHLLLSIQIFVLTTSVVFICLYVLGYPIDILSLVFFILLFFFILLLVRPGFTYTNYSFLVILVLVFSVYTLLFFVLEGDKKEKINRKSLAVSLSNEHDPVAEYLFEELSLQIENDTALQNRLNRELIDINDLHNFLKNQYFSGYWQRYNLQIALCDPGDSILLEVPSYQWFHCYDFYDQIVEEKGFTLPGNHFYYLDENNGRINYLGRFSFHIKDYPVEITLFIELDSRLSMNQLGYPELLLDEKLYKERLIEKYSYAKYFKDNLVAHSGEYSYSLGATIYGGPSEGFRMVNLDGFNHLLYTPEKDNLIIISRESAKFIDLLVAFSYIFLFYYLCIFTSRFVINLRKREVSLLGNLRGKIQFTIISILMASLLLIGGITIWLNIRNYRKSQDKILHEKIQSVLIELTHKLSFEDELTPYWQADQYDNLDQLLIKFSDVFYTDINLYDPKGRLLATSRAEIFQLGLQGEKIDPLAYIKLIKEQKAQFIHQEKIGKLSYLSAYVPFENAEGNLLAYLNLPYFTKQKELQSALSALAVTIMNIYVILILITIVITILISDQITKPLELLQRRFRELKLGSEYEKIYYKRKDEIGNLVAEYNRMVGELERSVSMLARSERESAWREMAKQIAHEIKNPLTPMRLSVQQLKKSWDDGRKDFDEHLQSVSNILIEQIDNLSSIASEFSNFAKMPAAKIEDVDLIQIIRKAIELFEGNKSYDISFKTDVESTKIRADREQLSRVFINMIKNAMQSIPEDRKGEIRLEAKETRDTIQIRISDNGKGIPEDIKPKLFMPNFTTKTSGMGLGLAIVRNTMDYIGADISFETELGKGTTFLLEFPK
jgi:two-component system, NtrC family, nitrogen regulation sensor histidine kinase NtrY